MFPAVKTPLKTTELFDPHANANVSAFVHAIIPLSLLEAMKNLDTPVDDGLQEVADELVSKRLGLSATVASQISRYRASADRDGAVSWGEAVSVFRLVGRRPDASLVYADAGRRAARHGVRRVSGLGRLLLQGAPRGIRRAVGRRLSATVAREVIGARLRTERSGSRVDLTRSLATEATAEGVGCIFYASAIAELLRLLSGFEGAMVHDSCRSEGADQCTWRTATTEGYE